MVFDAWWFYLLESIVLMVLRNLSKIIHCGWIQKDFPLMVVVVI